MFGVLFLSVTAKEYLTRSLLQIEVKKYHESYGVFSQIANKIVSYFYRCVQCCKLSASER